MVLCDCICSNCVRHQSSSSKISLYSNDESRLLLDVACRFPCTGSNKLELVILPDEAAVDAVVSSELFVVDETERFFLLINFKNEFYFAKI
jgi:hypothetical protein